MPKLIIRNLANTTIAITTPAKTLLTHIQDAHIDWMQACGGKGRCTTCRMNVLQGMENISPLSVAEIKYRVDGRIKPTERLACQCYILGEVIAEVPFVCRLPHMKYTS